MLSDLPTPIWLPVHPVLLLSPLLLFWYRDILTRALPQFLTEPAFMLVAFYWVGGAILDGWGQADMLNTIGRYTGWMLGYLVLLVFAASKPNRWRLVWRVTVAYLLLSLFWHALELGEVEPFRSWRHVLYRESEAIDTTIISISSAYGLSSSLASYGYQLSVIIPLSFGMALQHRSDRIRWLFLPIAGLGVILTEFSTQRSALLGGIASCLLLLLFYYHPNRRSTAMILRLGLISGIIVTFLSLNVWQLPFSNRFVTAKLTGEGAGDIGIRLSLQLEALRMLIEYPAGTILSGVTWEQEGYANLAERFPSMGWEALAVHNGYLTRNVRYGIIFFIFTVWLLVRLGWLSRQVWRLAQARADDFSLLLRIVVAMGVSIFYLQSMFHNNSLLTRDGPCVMIAVLLVAGYYLPTEEYNAYK